MTTVLDRINELTGEDISKLDIDDVTKLTYYFDHGYEKLSFRKNDQGLLEYAGAYHPNGVCEGRGICIHCGRTLEFD